MASPQVGKSSGTAAPGIGNYSGMDDEKYRDVKVDDYEVRARDVHRLSQRSDPVTDLKQRLSMWGMLTSTLKETHTHRLCRSQLPRGQKRVENIG